MSVQQLGGIGDLLIDAIERHGGRTAIEHDGLEFSYDKLGADVTRTIAYFEACGIEQGARIAQIAANSYEMFVVIAAAYIGGYVSLALQYNADFDDHLYAIDEIRPTLLFVDGERQHRAAELAQASSAAFLLCTYAEFASVLANSAEPVAPLGRFIGRSEPGACARIMLTGGTSGKPKAVMTSSASLTFQALAHVAANAFDADTRMLIASPISHGGGSFIPPVLAKGGRVVIDSRFRPAEVIGGISGGRLNTLFLVPTMLYALMDHPDAGRLKPGQLKRLIYGAAPASPERVRQAMALFGPVLLQSYGLSEAPGTILYLSPEDHQHPDPGRLASAGRPYPGVIARLMADGKVLPARSGEVGEIVVRAPHVMMGYWNAPELTAEAFEGGWLHTGDLARVDDAGFFHIVSRLKDMIISGGFNVYACEVEQALEEHGAVAASAVIGIPDPKWGEAVTAFVVVADSAEVTEEALIAFVRERKGPIKTPKTVTLLPELPLTRLGKVDKNVLRSGHWPGRHRAVN